MNPADILFNRPLFLDCGDPERILKAFHSKLIQGVTTNPSLLQREGGFHSHREIDKALLELCEALRDPAYGGPIPISLEIDIDPDNSLSVDQIVKEGLRLRSHFGENVVVKIPVSPLHCFDAMKMLSEEGVPVNATLIARWEQAVFAAKHGAKFVSPFLGRIDDLCIPGYNGLDLLTEIVYEFDKEDISTSQARILAASIRSVQQTLYAFTLGAYIVTVPWDILMAICDQEWHYAKTQKSDHPFSVENLRHPVTEAGLLRFHEDFMKIPLIATKSSAEEGHHCCLHYMTDSK